MATSTSRSHGVNLAPGVAWVAMVIAVVGLCLAGCGRSPGDVPAPIPVREAAAGKNVLIVLLDAAATRHFGCYGYPRDTTPHLDRIAAESVVFENAYAQASGTMRSVYSFFTSRYPVFSADLTEDHVKVLSIPPEAKTMAEYMGARYGHRLGYTSNTWMKRDLGHDQGFTQYWEIWDFAAKGGKIRAKDRFALPRISRWMQRCAQDGFFAYLHFIRPHVPHDQPEPYRTKFVEGPYDPKIAWASYILNLKGKRPRQEEIDALVGLYDGNLAFADHMVGTLVADLDSTGIWENTIFVLMSDHGQGLFHNDKPPGHGGNVYEPVIRVPLFIRIPGVPPRRISEPVELVDLLPTLVDVLDIPHDPQAFVGHSLAPFLAGKRVPDHLTADQRVIHSRTNRRTPPVFSIRRGRYKWIACPDLERQELYDLREDPAEMHDLLAQDAEHPAARDLESYFWEWLARAGRADAGHGISADDAFDARDLRRLRSLGYID